MFGGARIGDATQTPGKPGEAARRGAARQPRSPRKLRHPAAALSSLRSGYRAGPRAVSGAAVASAPFAGRRWRVTGPDRLSFTVDRPIWLSTGPKNFDAGGHSVRER